MSSYQSSRRVTRTLLYLVISVIGFAFVFPFLWMIVSSFKLNRDVLAIPIQFFPPTWNWMSYVNVFTKFPDFNFPRFILNSLIVTTARGCLLPVSLGHGRVRVCEVQVQGQRPSCSPSSWRRS